MKMPSKKKLLILSGLLLALIGLRLSLALLIKSSVNQKLEHMERYRGHINGVGLSIWRGAYQFGGVSIVAAEGKVPEPLFSAELIDIGLQWKALFQGRLVAKVQMRGARVNFIAGPAKAQNQSGKEENWAGLMQGLVPLSINHLSVVNGEVHFRDPYHDPAVDISLKDFSGEAENLSSRQAASGELPSAISARARLLGQARSEFEMRLDPFAADPTFKYKAVFNKLELPLLNPFLRRYTGIDVAAGSLSVFSEGEAAGGSFKGYVKPLLTGLKVMKPGEKLGPLKLLKKGLAGIIGWIFKNHPKDRAATRIEFAGKFGDPKIKLWTALGSLLENAFVKAIPPKLDGQVDLKEFKKE